MTTLPGLLRALVVLSGSAGLVYEMLWIRALGLHFGTTTPAVTTVVATYMAGLGFGNLWFGRLADRSARPFALYRRLEASIAVSGLLVSLFLLRGGALLDGLARLCAHTGSLSTLAMASVLGLLMLVPATALGGTLPVLSRALSRHEHAGRTLGSLYGFNTLGAIVGALAPDFVLIPRYGLTFTAGVAAASNLIVALALQRYVEPRERPRVAPDLPRVELSRQQRAALALSACSGFCAMGLEVLWSRTLQHWATALVTSFAVLLAVYLAALAAGALFAQRWADRSDKPMRVATVLAGVTAVCALLPIVWAPDWRDLERVLWPRPGDMRRLGVIHEAIDALCHASYLEGAACFAMGATFPYLAAACLVDDKADTAVGTRTGQLLLVNTFAGVLGALALGFVGLPRLGEQASYQFVALLLASVAAVCAWVSQPSASRNAVALGALSLVLALVLGSARDSLQLAHFRSGGELLALQQGSTTSAAAVARFVYGEPYYRELLTPGVSMSSTRPDARRYMALMAHTAMLSAKNPRRALLICYGVGNTAAALLSHARLQHLDVVDISPEVLALAPYFSAARGDDPLRDPRTRVYVDDGRHHLITQDVRYDVITAEPPPPNDAGVVNLYSREFYRLAKHRLNAGGVITQWLPVFQLSDDDVRAMIAAFVAELPHTALLYGYAQQLVLIGSQQPLAIDAFRLEDPALAKSLHDNYIGSAADLLGSVIQNDRELRGQVAGVAPLSDQRPSIQYPFQAVSAGELYTQHLVATRARALLAAPVDAASRAAIEAAAQATQAALSALPLLSIDDPVTRELAVGRALQSALAARPTDEGLWALLGADRLRVALAQRALQRSAADSVGRSSPRYWVLQDALWVLARRAYYAHDCPRAIAALDRITPEPPLRALHALLRASCAHAR